MKFELEQIVRDNSDMVLRLALSYTGNKADAEDVFQEVFVRLVRSIDKIESKEHLSHWLIRVTINRCKSLFSKAYMKRELPVDELPETAESAFLDTPETSALDALQELPEKYRVPLHLFYFEDMSIAEISNILDSTEGTIKSQLSRGRKMLSDSLKKVSYV